MRPRLVLAPGIAALALALLAIGPGSAAAHPLGNFSVNHLSEVRVSSDRVEVLYILDQAEIPTFQERGLSSAAALAGKRAAIERGLALTADGRRLALRATEPGKISFPAGEGGLKLMRIELPLSAQVSGARRVELRDDTFGDRVGWKAIVARPGEGTAVRSSVTSTDPTRRLRAYPEKMLQSPHDERIAELSVEPGGGTVTAPSADGVGTTTTKQRSDNGFAGVFSDAAAGEGVLLLFLLAAFGWGALHALSPGHGKGMVAAYLVGTRGRARHALALGATVTFTHTIGVFLLGVVTLALSQYILPEQLYPWLNLAAGLLVVTVGLGVLRSRLRWARLGESGADAHVHDRGHARHHDHGQSDGADHDHSHDNGHDHHHSHSHGHGYDHHHIPDRVTWRGLLGMGVAAGLLPCPSALVVLLGAIAQHEIALGLLLITAFSIGLAATLTALGLAVVYAGRFTARLPISPKLTAALPAASAVVIVVLGLTLTAQAVPDL